MERSIPHVFDIFTSSPGARRRIREEQRALNLKEQQKNSGSDSAVSVGSSEDEGSEEGKNIAKYFEYLNDAEGGGSSNRKKKKKKSFPISTTSGNLKEEAKKSAEIDGHSSRKAEYEKDLKHIERHLSIKKTIRKKMMRDLQQAFVEDPCDLQQPADKIPQEKKNNIDLRNLTLSKKKMSKSDNNFLDMLKDEKTSTKSNMTSSSAAINTPPNKRLTSTEDSSSIYTKRDKSLELPKRQYELSQREKVFEATYSNKVFDSSSRDDDSGNDSPTRSPNKNRTETLNPSQKEKTASHKLEPQPKEEKKPSFWKRLTGKAKTKR